jgi:hypothetical protein
LKKISNKILTKNFRIKMFEENFGKSFDENFGSKSFEENFEKSFGENFGKKLMKISNKVLTKFSDQKVLKKISENFLKKCRKSFANKSFQEMKKETDARARAHCRWPWIRRRGPRCRACAPLPARMKTTRRASTPAVASGIAHWRASLRTPPVGPTLAATYAGRARPGSRELTSLPPGISTPSLLSREAALHY